MFDKMTTSNKESTDKNQRQISSPLIKINKVFLFDIRSKLKSKLEFAYVE